MSVREFHELELEFGQDGVRRLAIDIADPWTNNYKLAEKWGLSVYEIVFLRKDLPDFCFLVMSKKERPLARILKLTA